MRYMTVLLIYTRLDSLTKTKMQLFVYALDNYTKKMHLSLKKNKNENLARIDL